MAESTENNKNPLLTEFDIVPFLRKRWTYEGYLGTAAIWLLITSIPLILGSLAGTNCLWVNIQAENQNAPIVPIAFGYLAEPNHGVFYLVGMVIFIFSGIAFLERAGLAVTNLAGSKQLVAIGQTETREWQGGDRLPTVVAIEKVNRRFFTVLLWILPSILIALLLATELPTLQHKSFGWVQSSNVAEYHQKKLRELDVQELLRVEEEFRAKRPDWKTEDGKDLEVKVVKPDLTTGDWRRANETWFKRFLVSALLAEWVSHVIIGWIAFKTLFFVWILISANWVDGNRLSESDSGHISESVACQSGLRRLFGRPARFVLSLNFYDPLHRLGISHLDPVYNSGLFLGLLGAITYWAGRVSNLNKGTVWILEDPDLSRVGQLIVALVVLLVVGAICGYPFWHLVRSVAGRKRQIVYDLVNNQNLRPDDDKVKLVESQSLWPGWKTPFVFLASMSFILAVLMPLGLPSIANILPGKNVGEIVGQTAEVWPRVFCPSKEAKHVPAVKSK